MYTEKGVENDLVSLTDVSYSTGIDTYVRPGKQQNDLVVEEQKRATFFKSRRNLHALLEREATNPVVEEGSYASADMRTRKGEHYLTHEAITLFIEHSIRSHKAVVNGLPYNSKNIFVVKNDEEGLHNILNNLVIKINDDAKFIYIDEIHSIPFYIRNVEGRINCFFVDSASEAPSRLIDLVKHTYPGARIFYSTVALQKDFYSCSTFAIKSLLYFVKHGVEVFPYLDALAIGEGAVGEAGLMPELLKMNQNRVYLSDTQKNTVVSVKQKLTLSEYIKKYSVEIDDKPFNAAALIKKYKYFDLLNKYITQNIGKNSFPADLNQPLPIELKERHDKYSRLPNQVINTTRYNLIDYYLELQSNLDTQMVQNHEVPLSTPARNTLQAISKKYPQFQNAYVKRFSQSGATNSDSVLIEKLLFIAAYDEMQDLAHLTEYMDFAIKLTILFASYKDVSTYFKKHAQPHAKQPIHDLCLFNISAADQGNWDKAFWGALVLEYGPVATKYLALAPVIDALLIKHKDTLDATVHNTVLKRIKAVLVHHNYKRADENPELAGLCLRFKRSAGEFEHNLELVQKGLKSYDVLPEITINGADLNPKLAKFTFCKLPINDLRGFFLGEFTSCCQSLNKQGSPCAIDGMTSAFSGFYVVFERGEIVAQTWAWVGTDADFVFDSWEFVNKDQHYICEPFISKAAELIIESGFKRVLLGKGGKTPQVSFKQDHNPGKFRTDCQYSDAKSQYLIKANSESNKFNLFTGFVRRHNCNYDFLSDLFADNIPAETKTQQLMQLINDKKLTFDQFFYLVAFFYIHQQEILHQLTPSNNALLQVALKTFGRQMYPLFMLESTSDDSVLGIFIRMDANHVEWIFNYLGEYNALSLGLSSVSSQDNFLIYELVRSDNITTLTNLKAANKIQGSWEDLALTDVHRKKSALYYAAKYNATHCLKLFLANKINNHERLKDIIFTTIQDYEKANIFHFLAKADAIDIFKHIIETNFTLPMHKNSTVGHAVLYVCAPIYTDQNLPEKTSAYGVAFFSNSHKVLAYLNELGFLENGLSILGIYRAVKYLTAQNDIGRIKYLRSLHKDEQTWLSFLSHNSYGYHPIRDAHIKGFSNIANYLFDSFTEFENLHKFLTSNHDYDFKKDLFDIFFNKKLNQEELLFLKKMLLIYKDHGDKLNDVISLIDFLCIAVVNSDLGLFKSVLGCYSSSKVTFDDSLGNEKDKDSILMRLIKFIDGDPVRCQAIDLPTKKIIIDSIFKACTQAQQKKLVSALDDWSSIKRETTILILNHIKLIDKGQFSFDWARLDANGPLKKSLMQYSSFEKDSFPVLLAFYDDVYGAEKVNAFFILKSNNCSYYIFRDRQLLPLLQRLFKFIGDDVKALEALFWDCYATSKYLYSGSIYQWIFDYEKLPDSVLIEAVSTKKRHEVYYYDSSTIMNLIMTAQVWVALGKRLDKQQLYSITLAIYKDFYNLLLKEVSKTDRAPFDAWALGYSLNVFGIMNQCIAEFPDNFQMRLEVASDYLAKSNDDHLTNGIMLVLTASTVAERQELLQGVKEQKLLKRFKNNLELVAYIEAINHVDQLTQLKVKLEQIKVAREKPNFFKPVVDECETALKLIDTVEKKRWYSFDEDNNLAFSSTAEINQSYNEVVAHVHKVQKIDAENMFVPGPLVITQEPQPHELENEEVETRNGSSWLSRLFNK